MRGSTVHSRSDPGLHQYGPDLFPVNCEIVQPSRGRAPGIKGSIPVRCIKNAPRNDFAVRFINNGAMPCSP